MSFISKSCQDPRSLITPTEHVGKHSDGVAGWRLDWGSGGICTCLTDSTVALGEPGELLAQAASSSVSPITIITKGLLDTACLPCVGFHLVDQVLLAQCGGALMLQCLLAGVGFCGGEGGLGFGVGHALGGGQVALHHERDGQHCDDNKPQGAGPEEAEKPAHHAPHSASAHAAQDIRTKPGSR